MTLNQESKIEKLQVWKEAAATGLKSRGFYRLYVFGILLVYCALFYYFGGIADLFGWAAVKLDIFYSAHALQRMAFLVPIIYASLVFGKRGAILSPLVSFAIILPRFLFAEPEPLLPLLTFFFVAGLTAFVTTYIRTRWLKRRKAATS